MSYSEDSNSENKELNCSVIINEEKREDALVNDYYSDDVWQENHSDSEEQKSYICNNLSHNEIISFNDVGENTNEINTSIIINDIQATANDKEEEAETIKVYLSFVNIHKMSSSEFYLMKERYYNIMNVENYTNNSFDVNDNDNNAKDQSVKADNSISFISEVSINKNSKPSKQIETTTDYESALSDNQYNSMELYMNLKFDSSTRVVVEDETIKERRKQSSDPQEQTCVEEVVEYDAQKVDELINTCIVMNNQDRFQKRLNQMKKRKFYVDNDCLPLAEAETEKVDQSDEESNKDSINEDEQKLKSHRRNRNRAYTSNTINFNSIYDDYMLQAQKQSENIDDNIKQRESDKHVTLFNLPHINIDNTNTYDVNDMNQSLSSASKSSVSPRENMNNYYFLQAEAERPIKTHSKSKLAILSLNDTNTKKEREVNFKSSSRSEENNKESIKEEADRKYEIEDDNENKQLNLSDLDFQDVIIHDEEERKLTAEELIIKTNNFLIPSEKRGFFKRKNQLINKLMQREDNFTQSYMMALGLNMDNEEDKKDYLYQNNLSSIMEENDGSSKVSKFTSTISNKELESCYSNISKRENYSSIRKKSLSCFFINENFGNRYFLEDKMDLNQILKPPIEKTKRSSYVSW